MAISASAAHGFSIVLVNYKSLELTQTCLSLLHAKLQGAEVPVYVVDNDSNDASVEYLRTLDWIHLLERKPQAPETGTAAHGHALDMALEKVETEYVFLLHTDTFIHDASVFEMMLAASTRQSNIAAVGCLEQLNRGLPRTLWRLTSRFAKHYYRRSARAMGVKAREPKPYTETHLKSFCALWNVRIIKQHGLKFLMDDRCPGYALQDRLIELGYGVRFLSPRKIFRYLDHVQSGTVAALGGYGTQHRRADLYRQQMENYRTHAAATPQR